MGFPSPNKYNTEISNAAASFFTDLLFYRTEMKAVEVSGGHVCLIYFGFDLHWLPGCEGCTAMAVVGFSSASHFQGDYPVFPAYPHFGSERGWRWSTQTGSFSGGTKLEGADEHLTHSVPTASSPPPRRVQRGSRVADYSSTPAGLC